MKSDLKPFETLLLAFLSKEPQDVWDDADHPGEAALVFSKSYAATLPPHKVQALTAAVYKKLSADTLGRLVTSGLSGVPDSVDLRALTGLSASLVADIQADRIFPNSIPIKSLVKLLKFLEVPLDKARKAVEQTFDYLLEEKQLRLAGAGMGPVYRKAMQVEEPGAEYGSGFNSDESYLYQNKEALALYLDRLTALYSQPNENTL